MMPENGDAVQPNSEPSRGQAVTHRRSRSGRRTKRRHEEIYRSIDAPWLGEAVLLGLHFWTVEDFAGHAKITVEQVQEWIEAGLPALQLADGSVRISEAAADEWAKQHVRQPSARLDSPYLTIQEAASYCRLAVGTIYNHRSEIQRVPGIKKLLFRREDLDVWLRTRSRKR
jgi:hypothetical protein